MKGESEFLTAIAEIKCCVPFYSGLYIDHIIAEEYYNADFYDDLINKLNVKWKNVTFWSDNLP